MSYLDHFGLIIHPFENVPNPSIYMEEGQYGRILSSLLDSVSAGRGLMIVSGPIGSGKTTMSQKLVSRLGKETKLIWMAEPPSSSTELFAYIARELELESDAPRSFLLDSISKRLKYLRKQDTACLLIVDESHHMNDDLLEGIRILTNLESWSAKLLQIMLLGQPELADSLKRENMEPLRQRVAVMKTLENLTQAEAVEYVCLRLKAAGAENLIFEPEALSLAAHVSGGIPRILNNICQAALETAFLGDKAMVSPEDVHQASLSLGLGDRSLEYLRWQRRRNDPEAGTGAEEIVEPGINQPVRESRDEPAQEYDSEEEFTFLPDHSDGVADEPDALAAASEMEPVFAPTPPPAPPRPETPSRHPLATALEDIPFEQRRKRKPDKKPSNATPLIWLAASAGIFLAALAYHVHKFGGIRLP